MNTLLLDKIRLAWADISPPFRISGSNEGSEPMLLERDFAGKPTWDSLEPTFLDQVPDGFSTALSFFADEAFRYYIAAYMSADLKGKLDQTNVVFSLTHGLDDNSKFKRINQRRFGEQRWLDLKSSSHSMFFYPQVDCIISYLKDRASHEKHTFDRPSIEQALINYWIPRFDWLQKAEQDAAANP